MSEWVTITEHIRFNTDGSSDHIKVVEDEVLSFEHFDKSPFFRIDPEIAWIIQTGRGLENPIVRGGTRHRIAI